MAVSEDERKYYMKFTITKKVLASLVLALTFLGTNIVNAETYTVASGDTLSGIASRFNTTVEDLVQLNQVKNKHLILIGQVLEVSKELATPESVVEETTTVAETVPTESTEPTTPTVSQEPTDPVATTPAPTTPAAPANPSTGTNLSPEDAAAKEEIARRESGGSYTAENGQFYGRYQLTKSYLNGDFSPENQERVADAYVAGRYGSWSAALAFHNIHHWY